MPCEEWRSGSTLVLDADGRFNVQDEMRSYCRGRVPAFQRKTWSRPGTLEECAAWGPPVRGAVPHLSCESGRWWNSHYGFRYVGDTLELGSDCDGSETYVMRAPHGTMRTAIRSSDVSTLSRC
ncbi:MAG: hypothetical protein H0X64_12220 [Gemmatimonadaceae bacterium]|nr:hypothetical protein [Gemmatimonadaceae bacterium]